MKWSGDPKDVPADYQRVSRQKNRTVRGVCLCASVRLAETRCRVPSAVRGAPNGGGLPLEKSKKVHRAELFKIFVASDVAETRIFTVYFLSQSKFIIVVYSSSHASHFGLIIPTPRRRSTRAGT